MPAYIVAKRGKNRTTLGNLYALTIEGNLLRPILESCLKLTNGRSVARVYAVIHTLFF